MNTVQQLKIDCETLAKILGEEATFSNNELEALLSHLTEGERILSITRGLLGSSVKSLITLTDLRLLCFVNARGNWSFDLDKICNLASEISGSQGKIHFMDGTKVTLVQVSPKILEKFLRLMTQAITDRKNAPVVVDNVRNHIITDLERLAGLKDRGVLAETEFDEENAKLLANGAIEHADLAQSRQSQQLVESGASKPSSAPLWVTLLGLLVILSYCTKDESSYSSSTAQKNRAAMEGLQRATDKKEKKCLEHTGLPCY